MKPQTLFCVLMSIQLISCSSGEKTIEKTIEKSVTWLWEQQSTDGGWHSKTHNVLEDGRVLTPYILFHLLQLPEKYLQDHSEAIEKGISFIIKDMKIALDGDTPTLSDYPNYSAAYALRVLLHLQIDPSLQDAIAGYLLSEQFDEDRGFTPDSLAYGGWGYGESGLPFGKHGHVDVSHTRRVAEALMEKFENEAKARNVPELSLKVKVKETVEIFLKGVQRNPKDLRLYQGCRSRKHLPYDGGFIASVVTMSTIKSAPIEIDSAGIHYPSYATATCDGFMAMHALGMQETEAYHDAKKWLMANQNLNTIDGISEDDQEPWDEVMHYYHLAVRSEAMKIIDPDGAWKNDIWKILSKEQTPDGYYVNPIGGVNKEDDPLMATIFAIQAMTNISSGRIEYNN